MNSTKIKLNVDELRIKAETLKYGDRIELSGIVYTARDAAHSRLNQIINAKNLLPFEIANAVIYYAGPTETPFGLPIGSCGPTTSGRMDIFTPKLLDLGMAGMIGKGERSDEVKRSIIKNKAVYFCAIGGAGALAAKSVRDVEVVAFPELGCESIKRLYITDFPLVVAIDSNGGDIFEEGRKNYRLS